MAEPVSVEVEDFLSRLRGVRRSGANWIACCPCRDDDDNPSLSVGQGRDGRVLATCHRGSGACTFPEIVRAAGCAPKGDAKPTGGKEKLTLVKTYNYYDADGTLLFEKQRLVNEDGKKRFLQRKPNGAGGWEWSLGDTPRVLYNLPAVIQAVASGQKIYVVEGEKDADTLIGMGYVATTCPNGAGSWADIHTAVLAKAKVEIIADNDAPGLEHAEQVRAALVEAGAAVRVWRTPAGKDISDYLGMGGDLKKVVRVDVPASPLQSMLDDISSVFARDDIADDIKVVKAISLLDGLVREKPADRGRLVGWGDLVDEEDSDEYDWVIPGLLERQERVIVVAAEGVGKSTLARQVAILSAHGIHPFTLSYMPPIRTLYVDLENPERIVRRNGRPVWEKAQHYGRVQSAEAHLVIKPAGFDLLQSADRDALESHIEATKPDMLFMGPLYKAFIDAGGRTPEAIAGEVVRYLDYLRDCYKFALWLEHHAPLGSSMASRELRPFGSAVWSRWPEFGLALQPDPTSSSDYLYEVAHFRGEREPRQWPKTLKRGTVFPFEVVEFKKV